MKSDATFPSFRGGEHENGSGLWCDAVESGRWAPLFWKVRWLLGLNQQFHRWRWRQSVVPTDVPTLPDHTVFDHRTLCNTVTTACFILHFIFAFKALSDISGIRVVGCSICVSSTSEMARGGGVVKALRYKPAGRRFDSQWCHWIFFQWHNPSGHTMALGSTHLLTKMSTRCISWG